MSRRIALLPLLVLSLFACGEDDVAGTNDGGEGGTTAEGGNGGTPIEIEPVAVEFEPCTVRLGRQTFDIECATVAVALDRSVEDGSTIEIFVRRMATDRRVKRGQLWLLQGGPGSPGDAMLFHGEELSDLGYDVYIPDYRGVGRSTHFGCEDLTTDNPACFREVNEAFGDDAPRFSTTDAALDLAAVIEATRGEGEVMVYGVSYGTFMAERLLHLIPARIDGVILDSACHPSGCESVGFSENFNDVGKKVFDTCAEHPVCSEKLGNDPWGRVSALFDALANGHCDFLAETDERDFLRLALSQSFATSDYQFMGLSAMYRLERCSAEDEAALRTFAVNMGFSNFDKTATAEYDNGSDSPVLTDFIVRSEFWDEGVTLDDVVALEDSLFVSPFGSLRWAYTFEDWRLPIYETPAAYGEWPVTSTPILLLAGDWDPQTPIEDVENFEQAYAGDATKKFVPVRYSTHGVISSSFAIDDAGTTCGLKLVRDFLDDPTATLDTECAGPLRLPYLGGSAAWAQWIYGTEDLWENTGTTTPPQNLPPLYIQDGLRRVRTALDRPF